MRQLRVEAPDEDDDDNDNADRRALVIMEIQQQRRVLEADQSTCEILSKQARSGYRSQDIGTVKTTANSTAFVGCPESAVGKFNQRIGPVTTEDRSVSIVGVFPSSINMRQFARSS